MAKALNVKQLRFIELYQQSLAAGKPNATQAYIDAGFTCSRRSGRTLSARLLNDPRVRALLKPVKEAAEFARVELLQGVEINRDRIRLEMARLSFADPRRLFNTDGTVKGVHELDADTAAALAQFEVEESRKEGKKGKPTVVIRTTKIKFWDKNRALQNLADTELGVWTEDAKRQEQTQVAVKVNASVLTLSPEDIAAAERLLATSPVNRIEVYASAFTQAAERELPAPTGSPEVRG